MGLKSNSIIISFLQPFTAFIYVSILILSIFYSLSFWFWSIRNDWFIFISWNLWRSLWILNRRYRILFNLSLTLGTLICALIVMGLVMVSGFYPTRDDVWISTSITLWSPIKNRKGIIQQFVTGDSFNTHTISTFWFNINHVLVIFKLECFWDIDSIIPICLRPRIRYYNTIFYPLAIHILIWPIE